MAESGSHLVVVYNWNDLRPVCCILNGSTGEARAMPSSGKLILPVWSKYQWVPVTTLNQLAASNTNTGETSVSNYLLTMETYPKVPVGTRSFQQYTPPDVLFILGSGYVIGGTLPGLGGRAGWLPEARVTYTSQWPGQTFNFQAGGGATATNVENSMALCTHVPCTNGAWLSLNYGSSAWWRLQVVQTVYAPTANKVSNNNSTAIQQQISLTIPHMVLFLSLLGISLTLATVFLALTEN